MTDSTIAPPLPDSLRERLLKTLRLAQQGVGGERDNAETILDKLLTKHGLTRASLEELDAPIRSTVWFPVAVADRIIFAGMVARLFGEDRSIWKHKGKPTKRGVDLSAAEHVTLDLAWEVYKRAWRGVCDDLQIAFMRKHKLFDASGTKRYLDDLDDDERAAFDRQQKLVKSLDDIAAPGTKRLGGQR